MQGVRRLESTKKKDVNLWCFFFQGGGGKPYIRKRFAHVGQKKGEKGAGDLGSSKREGDA